jgi:PhoPQ-activated pathogenicity-related protein
LNTEDWGFFAAMGRVVRNLGGKSRAGKNKILVFRSMEEHSLPGKECPPGIRDQLTHQQESPGGPSEQISPYTSRGLAPVKDAPREQERWKMIDLWTCRGRFTLPKRAWQHTTDADGTLRLTVSFDQPPGGARLWVARSGSRDFRKARWESQPLEVKAGEPVVAALPKPGQGYVAYYADLSYRIDDLPQSLCTQLRIAGGEGK